MKYINQLMHFNWGDVVIIVSVLLYYNRKKIVRFINIKRGKINRISKTHVGNMGDGFYHEKLDKYIVKWNTGEITLEDASRCSHRFKTAKYKNEFNTE